MFILNFFDPINGGQPFEISPLQKTLPGKGFWNQQLINTYLWFAPG